MNEMKRMDTQFKNMRCVIRNDYEITNDTNTVDTLRMANFRFINEKDILKTFDELYNSKMNYLLERHKSDIEVFKGEHKDERLKEISYSKVINRSFNVIITMNNKRKNGFSICLEIFFNLVLIYRMGNSSTKTSENNYMEQIKSINIDDLDLSKIDALQLKALKEMIEKIEKVEKRKSDKIMYKLPAVNLCSYSLI